MHPPSDPMNIATLSGTLDSNVAMTVIRLPSGGSVSVATAILLGDGIRDTHFEEGLARDEVAHVIPLIEEKLMVGKRVVDTGKVRLIRTETEYHEQLNEPLRVSTFDIERVVLNRPVEVAPKSRQEGETAIYPVVEEQLILTKQLILKEEIRITKRDSERIDQRVITLRREHLIVERETVT